ncbi:hypothetical protein CesoFtcFv8_010815 [Champsocephalus esox]|uniref:PB1 domain-containing protein n=2 Tax=Champsocephalus esox TaxID=159716 RepID=A0AAN8BZ46_9TELE|nr:hypothetical protein CesoFtcFv8_010815 [Champsocephalus esox]
MHMLAPNGSIMELDSEFVKIKAHYSGDMLITDLAATLTFVELCEEVRMLCSVAKQQPITLKWIDDEGDPCTISSQMELEEALRIYNRTKRSGLLLHVFPSIPEQPGMPCPGEDSEYIPSAPLSIPSQRHCSDMLSTHLTPGCGVVAPSGEEGEISLRTHLIDVRPLQL